MPPMYGQRRSLRSGTKTGTRSLVLKTQKDVKTRESVRHQEEILIQILDITTINIDVFFIRMAGSDRVINLGVR